MNRKLILPALALAATGLTAAGCHSSSSSSGHVPAGIASSASALASVPGADAKQVLISAGVPISGTSLQQIAWFRSLAVKANREALYAALGIPERNRTAFYGTLLDAAKADHVLRPSNHAGRVQFFDVDLENAYTAALVVKS